MRQSSHYSLILLIILIVYGCNEETGDSSQEVSNNHNGIVANTEPIDTLEVIEQSTWTLVKDGQLVSRHIVFNHNSWFMGANFFSHTLNSDTLVFSRPIGEYNSEDVVAKILQVSNDTLKLQFVNQWDYAGIQPGMELKFYSDFSWRNNIQILWYSYSEMNTKRRPYSINCEQKDAYQKYRATYVDNFYKTHTENYQTKADSVHMEQIQTVFNRIDFEQSEYERPHELHVGEGQNKFVMRFGLENGEVFNFKSDGKELHPSLKKLKELMSRSNVHKKPTTTFFHDLFNLSYGAHDRVDHLEFSLPTMEIELTEQQKMEKELQKSQIEVIEEVEEIRPDIKEE